MTNALDDDGSTVGSVLVVDRVAASISFDVDESSFGEEAEDVALGFEVVSDFFSILCLSCSVNLLAKKKQMKLRHVKMMKTTIGVCRVAIQNEKNIPRTTPPTPREPDCRLCATPCVNPWREAVAALLNIVPNTGKQVINPDAEKKVRM